MKILVYQTAFLGDLLLSIPLLKNINACYPEAEISLVCRKPFGRFFESLDFIHSVFEVNKTDKSSMKLLDASLAKNSYELVFCPHESFRSAKSVGKLSANKKIGFRRWFSGMFFTHRVTRPLDLPDVLRQTSLLAVANKPFGEKWVRFVSDYRGAQNQSLSSFDDSRVEIPDFLSMQLDIDISDNFREKFNDHKFEGAVAIAPGSVWPTKRWRKEHFIKLCNSLNKPVFVLGSPGESELCEQVAQAIPGAVNLAGKTNLLDMYSILRQVGYIVCNDSGTMHMASVAGTPTVSAFGPTTLDIGYRPWSNNSLVAQIPLKCRPCGKHGHKKCPLGTHECMVELKPQKVNELISLLP